MEKQQRLDRLYLDIAARIAQESYGLRAKVGALIVKDNNIVSMGWNGTPSGMDNECEIIHPDGTMTTKPEVLHAESNALMKLAASTLSGKDGTLYVTFSPCPECAKLIYQAGIKRVVYSTKYRITAGILFLQKVGIAVDFVDCEHNSVQS